jgi:chromosome segregation ATPase
MGEKPLSQRIQEGLVPDLVSEIKALEAKNNKHKEQIAGLEELNHGLDYCAEQEEIKRKDAESRLAKAKKQLEVLKQTLRCYHEWDSPALRDIWSCFNELESALHGEAGK